MKKLDKICTAIYIDRALYSKYKAKRRILKEQLKKDKKNGKRLNERVLGMSQHLEKEFFRKYVGR